MIIFLLVLLYLDSYKLVNLRTILWVMLTGALLPVAGYWINGYAIELLGWNFSIYSRYAAPVIEEGLKACVLIYLFRTNRIGFLVDAAILGFAVGAGFGVVENFYYLYMASDAHIAVWVVRGFGTAIMHGGTMALFGVMAQTLTERQMKINPLLLVPGFIVAITIHSVFNHFPGTPILTTLGTLLALPPIFLIVFQKSANSMHEWLEVDFDEDALLMEQINSGEFTESRIGRFLQDLKQKFPGTVVVDMLCYLRLYTELALRAKGVLMMRENGLDTPVGERTKAKFEEMRYLEKSIGKTGLLAMSPFLQMTRKDLWQLYVLE
ncbi:MAG: PrsW family intramembrane metalloprotease [Xanthomonadales bacterium]|nr:PrsW family intramembrane metalloprotease [Xanthomonadales bacterium]MDH4020205.1 PrsW family intramembrane metalloprotease [Xanthomonadales bacterium]